MICLQIKQKRQYFLLSLQISNSNKRHKPKAALALICYAFQLLKILSKPKTAKISAARKVQNINGDSFFWKILALLF